MFSALLLLAVLLWVLLPLLRRRHEDSGEAARIEEKIRIRRALVEWTPDAASVHEALADALREAERLDEAIAAYEQAQTLEARPDGPQVGAGSGMENKLRLTRLEQRERTTRVPGQTLATRQQICRRCGSLNGPQARTCVPCGAAMPADSFFETLQRNDMRGAVLREADEAIAKMLVILLALSFASWMPLEVKGALLMATAMVLGYLLLRRIGGH